MSAGFLQAGARLEGNDQGFTSVSEVHRGGSVSGPRPAFSLSDLNVTNPREHRHELIPNGSGYAYVALGDSFSAGIGGAYWPLVHQKVCVSDVSNSWPALVANWLYSYSNFDPYFSYWYPQACSGYTTFDVHGMVDYLTAIRRLSEATQYITLTVGGNDIGFAEVITQCVKITGCHQAADNACSIIQQELYGKPTVHRFATSASSEIVICMRANFLCPEEGPQSGKA